jgi:hypothetical protein
MISLTRSLISREQSLQCWLPQPVRFLSLLSPPPSSLSLPHLFLTSLTLAHYSRYFKHADPSTTPDSSPNADTSPNITFDWAALRDACKSFLDSIIIELCFPRAPYPQPILFEILHDAIDESPAEAKRFPQALWDAVGDLSVRARSVLSRCHTLFFFSDVGDDRNR